MSFSYSRESYANNNRNSLNARAGYNNNHVNFDTRGSSAFARQSTDSRQSAPSFGNRASAMSRQSINDRQSVNRRESAVSRPSLDVINSNALRGSSMSRPSTSMSQGTGRSTVQRPASREFSSSPEVSRASFEQLNRNRSFMQPYQGYNNNSQSFANPLRYAYNNQTINTQDSGMCSMICSSRASKPELDTFLDAIENSVIDLEQRYVGLLQEHGVPADNLDLTYMKTKSGKKMCGKCKRKEHPERLNKDAGGMIASFEQMHGEIDAISRHLQNTSFNMVSKECC